MEDGGRAMIVSSGMDSPDNEFFLRLQSRVR